MNFRSSRVAAPAVLLAAVLAAGGAGAASAAPAGWMETMEQLYSGKTARTWEDLKAYTGEAAADRLVGADRRKAYLLNYKQLGVNYGEAVDFQLRREQVILCPQTAGFLYSRFTPAEVRYRKGSRPELERVVATATRGLGSEREKMLALMRFCRDLQLKRDPGAKWADYVYGGTEEQLIAKPEVLCETLGRLLVALCEVAGMPGRIVMHDLGGHIGAEIRVEGRWAYVDPRCGLYFLRPDGHFASVWELWQDPSILRAQDTAVKADVSPQWAWEHRVWKCETMYFRPQEVNGFQSYSLADAGRYRYGRRTEKEATDAGLYRVNEEYVATARRALGLSEDGRRLSWEAQPLRRIPIAYRHDGFSIFYRKPPMARADLERLFVDPLKETNAEILVWGLGPGSVFCYETRVGQVFGDGLTEEQRKLLRTGDLWVHENVTGLLREGPGPLRMAIERSHQLGLRLFARLEMNHEYGPADPGNWMWVALVGDLNKKNPQYRIGKSVMLDFKHPEVRDFKIAILREAAEAGADGISMDFVVYPPFFEKPDPPLMTQFVRDVRAMLDDVGRRQKRRIAVMARVPFVDALEIGLDWKTWMKEGLVDIIVPSHRRPADCFDIRIEEFRSLGNETGIPVYPTIWQALGFVDTDQQPSDGPTGAERRRRYDKPKTKEMYYAQALLFHRAGADGIQLGMSEDQWRTRPWLNDLADPEKVLFADKHYMVDPIALRPGTFTLPAEGPPFAARRSFGLRIGDDVAAARAAGYNVDAELVLYMRPLQPGEKLEACVNGQGPAGVSGDSPEEKARAGAAVVDPGKQRHESFLFEKEWWKRGEHRLKVPADAWKLGENSIELAYSTPSAGVEPPLSIIWIDLLLRYRRVRTD